MSGFRPGKREGGNKSGIIARVFYVICKLRMAVGSGALGPTYMTMTISRRDIDVRLWSVEEPHVSGHFWAGAGQKPDIATIRVAKTGYT